MAVYTHLSRGEIALLLDDYGVGEFLSASGIAEGVENTNYFIQTTAGRYILTLFERRMNDSDLPFFIELLEHLAVRGCRVPRFLADQQGKRIQRISGRAAGLIEFLPGVAIVEPSAEQSRLAGVILAKLHAAAADFAGSRNNALGLAAWHDLASGCGGAFDLIKPGLARQVTDELAYLDFHWPMMLPRSVIHADLFPDNVLVQGNEISGVIDFYFSCTEIRAFDLAVTHSAWCFSADGRNHYSDRAAALIAGYEEGFGLSTEERRAFPTLCRGAALRFFLTRAYDWINTPADALVTRKDPLAFLRRLDFYKRARAEELLGPCAEM